MQLKKKLPFALDFNELGFAKLKDLILTMQDEIKLELKGHNHPFAFLISHGKNIQSEDYTNRKMINPYPRYSEDLRAGKH